MSKIHHKMLENIPAEKIIETSEIKFVRVSDMQKIEQAILVADKSHEHLNKTAIDGVINTGDGTKYLADDGIYKVVAGGSATSIASEVMVTDTDNIFTSSTKSVESILNELYSLIQEGKEVSGVAQLKELQYTGVLDPGETKPITLLADFNKYDIRTVYFNSDVNIKLSIVDMETNGFVVYESIERASVYDIVNVPCEDKAGTNNMYLVVTNQNASVANVNISIKITNLI